MLRAYLVLTTLLFLSCGQPQLANLRSENSEQNQASLSLDQSEERRPTLNAQPTCPLGMSTQDCQPTVCPPGAYLSECSSPLPALAVNLEDSPLGIIRSSDGKLNCGAGQSLCSETFFAGETIVLHSQAVRGFRFVRWTGACESAGEDSCLLSVSADHARVVVGAVYAGSASLLKPIVKVEKPVGGLVVSQGIRCGQFWLKNRFEIAATDCDNEFNFNQTAVLRAAPAKSQRFIRWTGACADQSSPICRLKVDSAKVVSAEFGSI